MEESQESVPDLNLSPPCEVLRVFEIQEKAYFIGAEMSPIYERVKGTTGRKKVGIEPTGCLLFATLIPQEGGTNEYQVIARFQP